MKVSIIGGADTIDEYAYEADLVVRVNQHFLRQGGRADVLFLSGTEVIKQIPIGAIPEHVMLYRHVNEVQMRIIYGTSRRENKMMKALLKSRNFAQAQREEQVYNNFLERCEKAGAKVTPFLHVGPEFEMREDITDRASYELAQLLGCLPLTGVLAIHKMTGNPITKEVFVTGMNLYSGIDRVGAHNLVTHRKLLEKLRIEFFHAKGYPFLIFDKTLADSVQQATLSQQLEVLAPERSDLGESNAVLISSLSGSRTA